MTIALFIKLKNLCVQDEEDELFRRDFGQATLEDHFDKTVLPKVMQVKDFGRAGRTKYTHLVDQDTTEVSPWARVEILLTPTKAPNCYYKNTVEPLLTATPDVRPPCL